MPNTARLRLFIQTTDGERVYDFDRDEVVVGRDPEAPVHLDDRKLSRRHCRFYRAPDGWRIADLESRNGTSLNGTIVIDDVLREGDRVEIGRTEMRVAFPRVGAGAVAGEGPRSSAGRDTAPPPGTLVPLPVPRSAPLPPVGGRLHTPVPPAIPPVVASRLHTPVPPPAPPPSSPRLHTPVPPPTPPASAQRLLTPIPPAPVAPASKPVPPGATAAGKAPATTGPVPWVGRTTSAAEVEDLRRELKALEHLVAMNVRITSLDDEDVLLDAILDAAVELLGAGRGVLLLAREDHVTVRRARRPGGVALEDPASEVSISLAQTAIRERRSLLVDDAAHDGRFDGSDSVMSLGLHSVVCVPMMVGETVLGAIYVDDASRAGAFKPRDVRLLEGFSAQAAVALEQCRQRREAADRRREAVRQARRIERLNERLRRVLRQRTSALRRAREDLAKQADELGLKYRYDQIVGRSPAMKNVLRLVDRVTDLTLPVLIVGESGTGKELVARAIHFNGPRRRARIVGENCGAVPESLMESEFFGYMRGAFTGAVRDHPGLFEQADKGTLFLDEVGEMIPDMQKKFLRVLEEGEVRRVGAKAAIPIDVRIISATNRDLSGLLASGAFREDLYYRLAGVVIELPPLRDRREDIEPLLSHFLAEAAPAGTTGPRIEPGALDLLVAYEWPGNVRELRNEVRRIVALSEGGSVRPEHLSPRLTEYKPPDPDRLPVRGLKPLVEDLERQLLRAALVRHGWNKSRAATELGLSRLGLRKKLERYGMDTEQPPE